MSNRTLVELNHDYAPGLRTPEPEWVEMMSAYYRSADPKHLPQGVTFKNFRHHSDVCPLEKPNPLHAALVQTVEHLKKSNEGIQYGFDNTSQRKHRIDENNKAITAAEAVLSKETK